MTESAKPNGFRIKGWSDVLAILAIIAMLTGALAWGIRLDIRTVDHEARLSKLEAR